MIGATPGQHLSVSLIPGAHWATGSIFRDGLDRSQEPPEGGVLGTAQAGKAPGGLPSRTPWFVICHLGHILKLTRALTAHPVLILSLLIWVAWKSSWESFGRNSFLLQSFLSFGNGTLPITKHQIWPLNIFCSKICFKKILISLKQIY